MRKALPASSLIRMVELECEPEELAEGLLRLEQALARGRAIAATTAVLKDLWQYSTVCFAGEERLMASSGYPLRPEHARQHRIIQARLLELIEQHRAAGMIVSLRLLSFLREWSSVHRQGWDARFAAYLRETRGHPHRGDYTSQYLM